MFTTMRLRVSLSLVLTLLCAATTALREPLVIREDNFVLLARHKNTSEGYFSPDVINTGIENRTTPDANTYTIIGDVGEADLVLFQIDAEDADFDGWYEFELVYEYEDAARDADVLKWTQRSWLAEDVEVVDANLSAISDSRRGAADGFGGLSRSSREFAYLDGSADRTNWWHAVASNTIDRNNEGIPAHEGRYAVRMELWARIVAPEPRVVRHDNFVLLSRHKDVADGFFSQSVLTSGMENRFEPEANTYSIIGGVDPALFEQLPEDVGDREDTTANADDGGRYEFELIYEYRDARDGRDIDVLKWTQQSWLTENAVVGVDLSAVDDSDPSESSHRFNGLARSSRDDLGAYLDGSSDHVNWWHAVASVVANEDGIPAHERQTAYHSELWARIAPPTTLAVGSEVRFQSASHVNSFMMATGVPAVVEVDDVPAGCGAGGNVVRGSEPSSATDLSDVWVVTKGLIGGEGTYSFRSAAARECGFFLARNDSDELIVARNEFTTEFARSASWYLSDALFDAASFTTSPLVSLYAYEDWRTYEDARNYITAAAESASTNTTTETESGLLEIDIDGNRVLSGEIPVEQDATVVSQFRERATWAVEAFVPETTPEATMTPTSTSPDTDDASTSPDTDDADGGRVAENSGSRVATAAAVFVAGAACVATIAASSWTTSFTW